MSLDAATAEDRYDQRLADRTTPENLYERAWARTVFDRVLDQLEQEAGRRGQGKRMARLRPLLTSDEQSPPYAEIAAEWRVGESAVRAAVHRMRKELAVLLREEVGRTVANPVDVDDEVRYVLTVIAKST